MKFCLDVTTRKGCTWNNIKKPSRETVQCIVRQSEFLEKSLDTRLRITTGGSHKIRLSRNHVQSTGPGGPIPVYLQWKYRLSCWSNWEILDNMRLSVQWAGIWRDWIQTKRQHRVCIWRWNIPHQEGRCTAQTAIKSGRWIGRSHLNWRHGWRNE